MSIYIYCVDFTIRKSNYWENSWLNIAVIQRICICPDSWKYQIPRKSRQVSNQPNKLFLLCIASHDSTCQTVTYNSVVTLCIAKSAVLYTVHSSKICNNTHKTVKKTVKKNIMGHGINHWNLHFNNRDMHTFKQDW